MFCGAALFVQLAFVVHVDATEQSLRHAAEVCGRCRGCVRCLDYLDMAGIPRRLGKYRRWNIQKKKVEAKRMKAEKIKVWTNQEDADKAWLQKRLGNKPVKQEKKEQPRKKKRKNWQKERQAEEKRAEKIKLEKKAEQEFITKIAKEMHGTLIAHGPAVLMDNIWVALSSLMLCSSLVSWAIVRSRCSASTEYKELRCTL
eukprot:gnl/TRDRNA2_/TRDRNA2_176403_c4_seq1.p1 gnl/TRDRNA2_/TRDRNA2_176403_c4~~gnl/TRDRNA2_/TRDRNA2_176403_c4_seq1.p1  ORF type:complete len:200 (-),score=51.94 gnl/TRDRNA2_/TRDRNA2_176403_c4_seq1:169-768(-)